MDYGHTAFAHLLVGLKKLKTWEFKIMGVADVMDIAYAEYIVYIKYYGGFKSGIYSSLLDNIPEGKDEILCERFRDRSCFIKTHCKLRHLMNKRIF